MPTYQIELTMKAMFRATAEGNTQMLAVLRATWELAYIRNEIEALNSEEFALELGNIASVQIHEVKEELGF